ncbi:MAG: recombination mediator RecR [Paludibacteraceae bacterium]|jgi:recombination protein RecR|nr:recombination protein RecR [Paludibacteraceae bacterium]MDD5995517.1 recombination mediator RecR [Bacteroidales bacterium]MBQ6561757.1 recombination protein RecR [Paludibacteraceae bacterium]MBQ8020485.1 recombination protein RecR [Paludibacteraceae bacterium]MCR5246753.1 recombination mediator RecR [Paludibacteraceae bacterium]
MTDQFSSKLLEEAVHQISSLPGVGKKSALRLVLHLLNRSEEDVERFANAFVRLKKEVKFCRCCHNISDTDICEICSDKSRNPKIICVVQDLKDVMSIEATQQFRGLYHVLGGVISPIDGIGPNDLTIESLVQRVREEPIDEVVLALSTTMEGDTTAYYIYRRLENLGINITTLARGVATGDELHYADEVTLGRSIVERRPYSTGTNF